MTIRSASILILDTGNVQKHLLNYKATGAGELATSEKPTSPKVNMAEAKNPWEREILNTQGHPCKLKDKIGSL